MPDDDPLPVMLRVTRRDGSAQLTERTIVYLVRSSGTAVRAMQSTCALVRWDKLAPHGGAPDSGVSGNPARATVAYGKKGIDLQIEAAVKEITTAIARK